ncbi:glycoside hydrolase superfamily [Fennellomyces sp. T-0311]|nr:glycoside hydrolase superfamily [Fennellomyces sp. T-0311]
MMFSFVIAFLSVAALSQAAPGVLWGITYTAKASDGACHNADQVNNFVKRFKDNGITHIRTYSQECDQLPKILKAIEKNGGGMQVLAAAWIDGDNDEAEISALEKNVKAADYKLISGIAVGNEVVQGGVMDSAAIVGKINQVKAIFPDMNVGTVDTPAAFCPEMVDASATIYLNIHPFFGGVPASEAFNNLKAQIDAFGVKAKGKTIVVTEVGWPTEGNAINQAQPSVEGMVTLIKALKASNIKYYYFESHDSKWKDGGEFGIEPHFGILDAAGNSKIPGQFK